MVCSDINGCADPFRDRTYQTRAKQSLCTGRYAVRSRYCLSDESRKTARTRWIGSDFGATHRLVLAWLPLDIRSGDIRDRDVGQATACALAFLKACLK